MLCTQLGLSGGHLISDFNTATALANGYGAAFRLPWAQSSRDPFLSGQTVIVQNRLAQFGRRSAPRGCQDS